MAKLVRTVRRNPDRTGLDSSSDMNRLVARALLHFPEVLEVD